ncbi:hypothetical protein F4821DRAFT_260568 [Hypoxylon rubiginosum]|uniref:Uncharacterized protein n=1 Tax=Hypoxylon rubiginosum TaxID=110542 RepID=A0ACC0CZI2_9PEZI|nr:hypothetical protein F4821DRAFT_260568 [Hypoxylon rubiginosum]
MHSIKYTIVLRVLAVMNLLGLCFAAPVSTVASPGTITSITYDPAATTPPATTLPATTLPAPDKGNFVVTVINSHTAAISTKHDQGPNAPTAIRENNVGDIVKPGETFSFAVPTGWNGRLSMWEDGYAKGDALDKASIFEASFMPQNVTIRNVATPYNISEAAMAMDVSYVDGFTVPMVCECDSKVAFGCNLNLHEVCPPDLQINAKTCKNPYRDRYKFSVPPANIFKDCANMAYTYPINDIATYMNVTGCWRDTLCCVGTACSPHPNQKLCAGPGLDGRTQNCSSIGVGQWNLTNRY